MSSNNNNSTTSTSNNSLPQHLLNPDADLKKTEIQTAWDSTTSAGHVGVTKDVFGRRKWDLDHFNKKAEDRNKLQEILEEAGVGGMEGNALLDDARGVGLNNDQDDDDGTGEAFDKRIVLPADQRIDLQRRNAKLDLEKNIGKQVNETAMTLDTEKGGFYCKVCKCLMKDSATWLDHINGKKHQRLLGMNMTTKVSTLEDVMERLEELRERKRREKNRKIAIMKNNKRKRAAGPGASTDHDENGLICPTADNDPNPDNDDDHLLLDTGGVTTTQILQNMASMEAEKEKRKEDIKNKRRRKREKEELMKEEEERRREQERENESEETKMMREMGLPVGFK